MNRFLVTCVLLSALVATSLRGAESDNEEQYPLATNRIRDELTMHIRNAYLTFAETVVVRPVKPKRESGQLAKTNIVHLLFAPLWSKDGNEEGPAFPVLRPQLNLSSGQVVRFALVSPDGETVGKVADITPECRYLLTIDFGHLLPEQLTVTVQMSSPVGLNPAAELTYRPSNDGQPLRSGPSAEQQTVVHLIADPNLEPWTVKHGDETVPQRNARVILQRDVTHTFRFGEQ